MRRAWTAWSLDRLEACNITQTLAPARSTKSEPRDALSDACNMTSRKEAALGRRRGRSFPGRALPAGVPVVEQLPAGVERHGMMEELVKHAADAAAGENEGPPFAVRGLHGGM